VQALGQHSGLAPHPVGEAAMAELYKSSPNNTDFTVLKEEGFAGLNFAFIDGRAYYHGPRDTIENFDPASMQHHGANMIALARAFGEHWDRTITDVRVLGCGESVVEPMAVGEIRSFAGSDAVRICIAGGQMANAEYVTRDDGDAVDVDTLYVKHAVINEGTKLKRYTPAAMGRATPVIKRTSHVEIVVAERGAR
jgi:hypothetical protein